MKTSSDAFTLNLDPAAAAEQITSLRGDAAALTAISVPPGVADAPGPLAALGAALSSAIANTNDQAALLAAEACRVAENMEIFCGGATSIDDATARQLGVIQQ